MTTYRSELMEYRTIIYLGEGKPLWRYKFQITVASPSHPSADIVKLENNK